MGWKNEGDKVIKRKIILLKRTQSKNSLKIKQ